MSDKTKVITSRDVNSTTDYELFKVLGGNRKVDMNHVRQLQKLMLQNGNLTYEFPIVVDKEMNVIDGQHRLEALRSLGWEVGYMVEEGATINTVRAINRGNRNWSWRDIANSYADLGNENYKWFLSFIDTYPTLRFSPALEVCGGRHTRRDTTQTGFQGGGFVIRDKAKAHDIAKQVVELQDIIENYFGDFTFALIKVMESPNYQHERMVHKARSLGDKLPGKAKRSEYMRELEEMYNHGYPDDNKVRLF